MNKNNIIGLVLIGAILLVFSYLNKPSQEEIVRQNNIRDSIAQVVKEQQAVEAAEKQANAVVADTVATSDISANAALVDKYGVFANNAERENNFITLENDKLIVKISSKGGRVYSVQLKEFTTYSKDPVILFDGDNTVFGFDFFANNRLISTNDLYFDVESDKQSIVVSGQDSTSVSLKLNAGEGRYIEYLYSLKGNGYNLDFNVNLVKMNNIITGNNTMLDLTWQFDSPQQEKGHKNENTYTTIAYRHSDGEVDELSGRSKDASEEITTKLQWIAFKDQFFSSILVADDNLSSAKLTSTALEDGSGYIKRFNAEMGIAYNGSENSSIPFHYYFGPNKFKTLEKQDKAFEELVPLGWGIFGWVNRYVVIPVFNVLGDWVGIGSMGLIILILTILIKLVLFPLTYKSYQSSAKMRVLKPEVEEISKKFPKKEDAMKKQQATMALYKKAGASPMGGCVPLLVQMPIIIAMFRFFPSAFELRQKSFLWADDLSSYDAIITWAHDIPLIGNHLSLFTILMAVALFFSTKLSNTQMSDANAQMPGMKFMMTWGMPVMMIFWFNDYAAGLSYYYFLSNLITIGQTMIFRSSIDEDKLLKKLQENKKKPVKKSKFQARMEEVAKQRMATQKRK
ncbi:MAG: membrane protein insertase YidC [Bacteroidales bacterium]|nr:membrane protein insertase YidC [Bacteroidales bacterium]